MFGENDEVENLGKGQLTAVFGSNMIRLDEVVSISIGVDFNKPKNSLLRYFVAGIFYNGNRYQFTGSRNDLCAFLMSLEERGFYQAGDIPSMEKFINDLDRKAEEYKRISLLNQEDENRQQDNNRRRNRRE